MIICHCNVVRAAEIRASVRSGASTLGDVAMGCGAGGRCGGCRAAVEAVIADEIGSAHTDALAPSR